MMTPKLGTAVLLKSWVILQWFKDCKTKLFATKRALKRQGSIDTSELQNPFLRTHSGTKEIDNLHVSLLSGFR